MLYPENQSDLTPEERKHYQQRWYQAWRYSMHDGMGEDGKIFPVADTTCAYSVLRWCLGTANTFHWKVVLMGSYEQARKAIKQLRELTKNQLNVTDFRIEKQGTL